MSDRTLQASKITAIALLAAFAVLVFTVSATKIGDQDFWWHLALGKQVVVTHSIDSPDSFSYTFAGKKQFSEEWLADLLIYLSYAAGGFTGVFLLKSAVLLLMFLFLLLNINRHTRDVDRTVRTAGAVLALVVVLFVLRWRLFIRPFLFSYLMVALFIYVLDGAELSGKKRGLYLLPLLGILWVNLSKGAVLGPAIIGMYMVERVVLRKSFKDELVVLVLTTAALLINTEGLNYYVYLYERMTEVGVIITAENRPMTTQLLWGAGFRYMYMYQVGLVLAALYLALLGGWRKPRNLLLFAFFFANSLLQRRNVDFFAISTCLFTGMTLVWALGKIKRIAMVGRAPIGVIVAAAVAFVAVVAVPTSKVYPFGLGVKPDTFPYGAVRFMKDEHVDGRIFNSYPFGGYLIWNAPELKVFIDGRWDQLYSADFAKEYYADIDSAHDWGKSEQKWGFDVVLASYESNGSGRHFPSHIANHWNWALVYWDDRSAVFVKKIPKYEHLIDKYGYQLARPTFYNFSYIQSLIKQYGKEEVMRRMAHDAAMAPDNQEVLMARVMLNYFYGDRARNMPAIESDMKKVLSLKPDTDIEHAFEALLLAERGDKQQAARELSRAFALNPESGYGKFVKEKYGL